MIICSQCGIRADEGDEKCFNCGAPILTDVIPTLIGSKISTEIADANLLRTKGRFAEAISACADILRNNPENASAHALLGDIYVDQQNFREALGWYKLAVKLDPLNENYKKKVNTISEKIFGTEVISGNAGKNIGWSKTPTNNQVSESPIEKFKTWVMSLSPPVIITSTTLIFAIIGGIIVLTIFNKNNVSLNPSQPTAITEPTSNEPPQPDEIVSKDASQPQNNNLPIVIPPKPDVTENGDIPGLPGIKIDKSNSQPPVAENQPPANQNPVVSPPASNDNNNHLAPLPKDNPVKNDPPQEVAPLDISGNENVVKADDWKSKLSADLKTQADTGIIDRTTQKDGSITIEYHITDIQVDSFRKKKILFTTQWILYSLIHRGYANGNIVLICSAPDKLRQSRTTAFFTEITREQATSAISANNYTVFNNSMGNIIWRDDYSSVPL